MEQTAHQAENKMLKLAEKIRQLTCGMCRVGPGLYGFGVCNVNPARIGIIVHVTPDPYGSELQPNEITEYTATVIGHHKESREALDQKEIVRLTGDGDSATRTVAAALLELSKESVLISKQEYDEAFDVMARREMNCEDTGITEEEARKLDGLRWYEGKSPEEIVSFQLYEKRLCMPFDKFHEAVEAALGRPVWTHEFGVKDRLQDEYRQVTQARNAGTSRPKVEMAEIIGCLAETMGERPADSPAPLTGSNTKQEDIGPELTM